MVSRTFTYTLLSLLPLWASYASKEHAHPMHSKPKIDKELSASVSLGSGLRFHRIKQEGPCNLIFTPYHTAKTVNTNLDNRFTFVLSEINMHANVLFYGGFSFQFNAGYGAFPGKTHVKSNVQWDARQTSPFGYDIKSHTYTTNFAARVSRWFQVNQWFKLNVFFGWEYQLLRAMQQSKITFSSPCLGADFRVAFARRFVAHFEGCFAFSGEQNEHLRIYYPNIQDATNAGLYSSALFRIRKGSVFGPKVQMKVTYTFHKGWQFFYGMNFSYMRTKQRQVALIYSNSSASSPAGSSGGYWKETTIWSSIGAWIGIERQF